MAVLVLSGMQFVRAEVVIDGTFEGGNGDFTYRADGTNLENNDPLPMAGWTTNNAIDRASVNTKLSITQGVLTGTFAKTDSSFTTATGTVAQLRLTSGSVQCQGLFQNTGYLVKSGDTFSMTFDWIGKTAGAGLALRVFTSDDDTLNGNFSIIYSSDIATANGVVGAFSALDFGTVVGANVDKQLWVSITQTGANNTSRSTYIDNVRLNVTSVPQASVGLYIIQ